MVVSADLPNTSWVHSCQNPGCYSNRPASCHPDASTTRALSTAAATTRAISTTWHIWSQPHRAPIPAAGKTGDPSWYLLQPPPAGAAWRPVADGLDLSTYHWVMYWWSLQTAAGAAWGPGTGKWAPPSHHSALPFLWWLPHPAMATWGFASKPLALSYYAGRHKTIRLSLMASPITWQS